jgi:transcription initiation factor TFIIF subunit alpha
MKFQGQNTVNPYDESQFSRPLRLFRRAVGDKVDVPPPVNAQDAANEAERELMDSRRAERQAEREENQKLIAPNPTEAVKPVKKKQKKFVSYDNDNFPERQRRQQLRYEEARPWHLEDYDRKNIWVGNYEGPLSNQYALFIVDEGGFRMIPAEKYYKFSQTGKFTPMDADEAAKHMNQKFNMPRWAKGSKLEAEAMRAQDLQMKRAMREAKLKSEREDDGIIGGMNDNDHAEYQADKDGLDLEYDDMNDFQDDDEGKLFQDGEDEDAKEIESRIREEMRQAGLGGTGVKNEELDPEEEYRRQQIAEQEERKRTKRIRKQLGRREKKNEYLSDSEDPYDDDSDDEISEEEGEEEKKKREEEEAAVKTASANGEKSGSQSRGNNTPTGRSEKKDPTRLSTKRPGSPDLSDMSGNESSRKKAKGLNGRPAQGKKAFRVGFADAGSGDDSDASRASGSRPKIKLKGASPVGTPDRSRASSPSAGGSASVAAPAGSSSSNNTQKVLPTLEELRAAIPREGIEIKKLLARFKSQIPPGATPEFILLVKTAGQLDKVTKLIIPKAVS